MTRYWVEKSASMKRRCSVGATRTTSRRSSPPAERVRQRIVSLENPLEAGAWTSKTSGTAPSVDVVASQRPRTSATSAGSLWSMSGMRRHSTDAGAPTEVGGSVGGGADPHRPRRVPGPPARSRRLHPLLGGGGGRGGQGGGRAGARRVRPRARAGGRRARGGRPGRPAGAGRERRHRCLGRGLLRHVRVRRREGLDGGRRGGRPHRAARRGALIRGGAGPEWVAAGRRAGVAGGGAGGGGGRGAPA